MEDYTAKSKWVGGRVGEDGKPLRCADALRAAMRELGFTVLEEGKVGYSWWCGVGARASERVSAGVCCSKVFFGICEFGGGASLDCVGDGERSDGERSGDAQHFLQSARVAELFCVCCCFVPPVSPAEPPRDP